MNAVQEPPEGAAPKPRNGQAPAPSISPEAESALTADEAAVRGERAQLSIRRGASLQTRLTNFLAVALMGSLAVGLLAWYYREAYVHRGAQRQAASRGLAAHAANDLPLPPLGAIDPPPVASTSPASAPPALARLLGPAPPLPSLPNVPAALPVRTGRATQPPRQSALTRRLAGPVFTAASGAAAASASGGSTERSGTPTRVSYGPAPAPSGQDRLGALLTSRVNPTVSARVLPTRDLLLPKGAFIDCTLETAIDSSLPGLTTCITATDTFSADGRVVLLERGTKLVGETRGIVQQGIARVFVLWTEARTPDGVVVPLDSPGTDELGRSGLPGAVNRHFFQRFGAALLISIINGGVQGEIASQTSHGAVIVNPTGTEDVTTEALRSTVNIAPTVVKHNGDRIEVLVARDIDFRSVYALRPTDGH